MMSYFELKAATESGCYVNPPQQRRGVLCRREDWPSKRSAMPRPRVFLLPLTSGSGRSPRLRLLSASQALVALALLSSTKSSISLVRPAARRTPLILCPLGQIAGRLATRRRREIHIKSPTTSRPIDQRSSIFLGLSSSSWHLIFFRPMPRAQSGANSGFGPHPISMFVGPRRLQLSFNYLARKLSALHRHHNHHAAPIKWATAILSSESCYLFIQLVTSPVTASGR